MHSIKFVVFKLKGLLLSVIIGLFTVCLVLFSESNLIAAKSGLLLWATSVLPSLLPFFIATELLSYTNIISYLGKMCEKFARPFFNVPGEGIFAFLMGIISGYPIGAKIVVNLKSKGVLNEFESERLLAFTNNSNPLFIIATVGISLFGSLRIGIILFVSHLISSIIVGFIFRWWKRDSRSLSQNCFRSCRANNAISFSNLGEVLSKSISDSINSVLIVGGFIVLFSVICSILEKSNIFSFLYSILHLILNLFGITEVIFNSTLIGIVEITNGLQSLSTNISNTSILISSFLLGFGGISILLQILSITSKGNISIKPYIIGKILQGCFSVLFTFILLQIG